jgi:uncharacterized damage-inducible protein DinB
MVERAGVHNPTPSYPDWTTLRRASVQADEIRFLFTYDRWATRRVLSVMDGLDQAVWARTDVVGERGLGSILVHHLGASQRWRHAFQDTGQSPEPEREPLPTIEELRELWEAEWAAVDAWLPTVTDGFVAHATRECPSGRCSSMS